MNEQINEQTIEQAELTAATATDFTNELSDEALDRAKCATGSVMSLASNYTAYACH
jgi:hypothetical protein